MIKTKTTKDFQTGKKLHVHKKYYKLYSESVDHYIVIVINDKHETR